MLAIVRALERWHIYLYGIDFRVITDCNALVYAVNKASLNPRIARWTLALQDYRLNLKHRPGMKMAHVDALSRCAAYVNALPLEHELEMRQLADPEIIPISQRLELEDDPKFSLVNGLLYRKDGETLKFVVPTSMIATLLRAHHDEMGHCGFEKTIKGVSANYWFPSFRTEKNVRVFRKLHCLHNVE